MLTVEKVDLTNCDREPIHVIGHVQPYGALLALDPASLSIVQASENTADLFGISAERLIGDGLGALFDGPQRALLRGFIASEQLAGNPLHLFTGVLADRGAHHVTAHLHDELLILEIEPLRVEPGALPDAYAMVQRTVLRFQSATSFQDLCQAVVEEARRVTGFDRVMIYRFLEDGSGEVIAEDLASGFESYIGLRYPESDIPRQARALYLKNAVRLIPDARYAPAPVIPAHNPRTGRPLDMTYTYLRGVSSMHIEYLTNIGTRSSMSLALTKGDELWGLISCHHHGAPRRLPYEARTACELLARVVSLQLTQVKMKEELDYQQRIHAAHDALTENLARHGRVDAGLIRSDPSVLSFIACGGAAVLSDGGCHLLGATPPEAEVKALVDWLIKSRRDEVFATSALPDLYPRAASFKDTACGLLAITVSRAGREYALWFRPELLQTVHWAGDPRKPVRVGPMGDRLTPRRSFELWRETVMGRSEPFHKIEIDAARRLRFSMVEIVFRKNQELAALNAELERSNQELDAFAYIASHDLKEPLRGIYNYTNFLLEDYQDKLDEEGKQRLEALVRLTTRMQSLIDSLLHYSRVGKSALAREPVDMNEVVSVTEDALAARIAEGGATIAVPRPLPTVSADRIRVQEVMQNLVSNAIKYNDKPERRVEIGYARRGEPGYPQDAGGAAVCFYVKDNGIGIAPQHRESIFRLFKRLHPRDAFGGGAGAGLTITKRILERHGGRIWLDASDAAGTTFWFTAEPEEAIA